MKAAVCYEFGQPLVVEEVEIDPPQLGEVKVSVAATAICHSDIHLIEGEWGGRLPVVAGHEAAGTVTDVGDGVTAVKPGDRVVVSLIRSCGRCFYCASGFPTQCEGSFALDRESRLHSLQGDPIHQGIWTAAFAEHIVVHQSQVVSIPQSMPWPQAALLACGVMTGVGAVVNTAQVEPGSSVVVVGVGGVGLNAVQGAALSGAYPIIAVDLLDDKLAASRAFGATHTVNAAEVESLPAAIGQLTAGRGADTVFVTVGDTAAINQSFRLSRKRGTVVIVGLSQLKAKAALPAYFHVMQEKKVIGSYMGSARLNIDIPRLIQLYQNGRLKLDELISASYPLAQINEAIESTKQGHALRNVILF